MLIIDTFIFQTANCIRVYLHSLYILVYGFAAQKQIVDVCGHIRFDIFRTQTIRKHSYLILIINHCVAAVCRTNKLALETRTFRTLHEIKYSLRACCMTLGVSNRPYKLL